MSKQKDEATQPEDHAGVKVEAPADGPLAPVITEASADAGEAETEEQKAKRGKAFATYRGHASVARFGEYVFKPGVPVEIPKAIAEELLTFPNEDFEVAETALVEVPQVEE